MDIAVIVASTGRAAEIGDLLFCLARQTKQPSAIILSVASPSDVPAGIGGNVRVIVGNKGLTAQRNRGLEAVRPGCDIAIFYDDDFVPAKNSLAGIEKLFETAPEIASATGSVLLDGVKQGGISFQDAFAKVTEFEEVPPPAVEYNEILWAYGCNMAFRMAAIRDLRFDENLILHGWQEDMDFAMRVSRRGKVVKTTAFCGVHRGVNKGRSSGLALGFSQIVNPVYLVRKGAMSNKKAVTLIVKNFLANHGKILWPEPFIDRRGRALGNWHGLLHVLRGRADPTAILRYR